MGGEMKVLQALMSCLFFFLLYYNCMYSCMWQPLCPRQISLGTNKVILNIYIYIYIYIYTHTHTELLSKGCMYHIFIFLLKELRDYNEGNHLTVNHWSIYNVLYYISVQSTYFARKQPTGVSARQALLDILLNYIHIITEYIIIF